MTTIAEDLLLLLTGSSGHHGLTAADTVVAGALLAELAGQERIDLDDRGRIRLLDAGATADALLDEALLRLGGRAGSKPKAAIQKVGKGLTRLAYEQLARAELVGPLERRFLGVTLLTSWVPLDQGYTRRLREELVDVLAGRREPDLRTGSLISLLRASSQLGRALPRDARGGLTMNEVRRAAKRISAGRWAGEAVMRAVQEMNAAVSAAAVGAAAGGGD